MIADCYLVEPFTCKQTESISEVAKKLKEYRQRHIYVVDDDNKPVGIISITDILDKVVIEAKHCGDLKASEVMNKDIIVHDDKSRVRAAYKDMHEKGVVSCAIVDGGKMIGTLTMNEAVRHLADPKNLIKE